jgi:hypothetical protein
MRVAPAPPHTAPAAHRRAKTFLVEPVRTDGAALSRPRDRPGVATRGCHSDRIAARPFTHRPTAHRHQPHSRAHTLHTRHALRATIRSLAALPACRVRDSSARTLDPLQGLTARRPCRLSARLGVGPDIPLAHPPSAHSPIPLIAQGFWHAWGLGCCAGSRWPAAHAGSRKMLPTRLNLRRTRSLRTSHATCSSSSATGDPPTHCSSPTAPILHSHSPVLACEGGAQTKPPAIYHNSTSSAPTASPHHTWPLTGTRHTRVRDALT